jgi:transcriptional regulator with XRE-family HTH domain
MSVRDGAYTEEVDSPPGKTLDTNILGHNIKRLREAAGHTIASEFAASIGMTPQSLSHLENGVYKDLRLKTLLAIAKGIPCHVDDLLEGLYEPEPSPQHPKEIDKVDGNNTRYVLQQRGSPVPIDRQVVPHAEAVAVPSSLTVGSSAPSRVGSSAPPRTPLAIVNDLRAHANALSALAGDVMRLAARRGDHAGPAKKTGRRRDHSPVHKRAAGGGGRKR